MPDREKVISKIEEEIHLGEYWDEYCRMIDLKLLRDVLTLLKEQRKIGKWVEPEDIHEYVTPGGTPYYQCSLCGGSGHLHGVEYPKRKLICDNCGAVNSYPWERTYEDASSFA